MNSKQNNLPKTSNCIVLLLEQNQLHHSYCWLKQNLKIIFPVHPRTKKLIKSYAHDNIFFVEPLSYFEIQFLLTKAQYVLTDSGGLQKEAYFHRVPCITLRSETEWTETVLSGWNRLWIEEEYFPRMDIKEYGEGMSAKNIVNIIESYL